MLFGSKYLHLILVKKGISPTKLAEQLNITPQALTNWDKDNYIPEKRVSQITDFLKLSSHDVDRLLGLEPLHYSFRTKQKTHVNENEVSERMQTRSELIFGRFFGDNEVGSYDLTNLKNKIKSSGEDFHSIALAIRQEFTITNDYPLSSQDMKRIQDRLKANAYFLPFKQILLNIDGESEQTAVLFHRRGSYSILVDSDRTLDEAHFDKLHELVHIFFIGIREQSKQLEDLIDKVCGELIYPKFYIVEKIFGGDANSRPITNKEKLEATFYEEFNNTQLILSPKGLALALKDSNLATTGSDLFIYLTDTLDKKFRSHTITYSQFGGMDFSFSNRESLIKFFKEHVDNIKSLKGYPLFEKLKSDFLSDVLSSNDFADTFNLSLTDTIVIKATWKKES